MKAILIAELLKSEGVGEDMLHSESLVITNDQIKLLASVTRDIVAAPGVGLIAYPLFALLRITGTIAYGNANNDGAFLVINYPSGFKLLNPLANDSTLSVTNLETFFGSFPQVAMMLSSQGLESSGLGGLLALLSDSPTQMENQPIQIFLNNSGELTGGAAGNEIKVALLYVVYNMTTGEFE